MLPSGSIIFAPLPTFGLPPSVVADTAPSAVAITEVPEPAGAGMPSNALVDPSTPPAQPPLPRAWMRLFQFIALGSQISMPIPGEVDGAPTGPGVPGPTLSLTTQTS